MAKRKDPSKARPPVIAEVPEYKPTNVGEYEANRLKKAKRA